MYIGVLQGRNDETGPNDFDHIKVFGTSDEAGRFRELHRIHDFNIERFEMSKGKWL